MTVALVRPPSPAFADAVSTHPSAATIDPARACQQHRAYVATLRAVGVHVVELPPIADLPDACFVEDCAVIVGRAALLCRPGIPTRAQEPELLRGSLTSHVDELAELPTGATLDGGDVLRMGSRLYVGRSRRTNTAGADTLQRFAGAHGLQVRPIAVPAGFLHLQTGVTALDQTTLVGVPDALALFPQALRRVPVAEDEATAASVLSIPRAGRDGSRLSPDRRPDPAARLPGAPGRALGVRQGRRGPTCLSLRI
jgi:dimethylargininase